MAETLSLETDAVLVPRAVLDAIAEALASIVRVSGEGFSVVVERLDRHDGDPDFEDPDPPEAVGDEQDAAWIEWHTMRGSQKRGHNLIAGQEDDETIGAEDDFPPEGRGFALGAMWQAGAGCPIGDPDAEHDGREADDGY